MMRSWPRKGVVVPDQTKWRLLANTGLRRTAHKVFPEARRAINLSKTYLCTRSAGRPSNGRALLEEKAEMPKEGCV